MVDSFFCFETWRGARIGPHGCPILRPGTFSIALFEALRTGAIGARFRRDS